MTASIVVDLGFGDAGKGSLVDYLTRGSDHPTVIRFNGGAQAAHNVVTPEGQHHTFAQFGAGMLAGARTFLSRFMLIDPPSMVNESKHLVELGCRHPFDMLAVDEDALVVTLFHKLGNRRRETERGTDRHGSCGMGIGAAMQMDLEQPHLSIRIRDLRDRQTLLRKLREQQEHTATEAGFLSQHCDEMYSAGQQLKIVDRSYLKQLAGEGDLIFEGAQGVLLDENFGFHPYTTWSTCTFKNADTLLAEIGYADSVTRIGVLRAYMVRHGPGPFPTENRWISDNVPPDEHNRTGEWQGKFRVGYFDAVLARYAVEVCGGIDKLAITNIDRLEAAAQGKPLSLCSHYDTRTRRLPPLTAPCLRAQAGLTRFLNQCTPEYRLGWPMDDYLGVIEDEIGMPVSIKSCGPTAREKFSKE